MKHIINKHKFIWANKSTAYSVLVGILFLVFSLAINYFTNIYVSAQKSNTVTDLILDHIPTFDVRFVFVQGAVALILFIIILTLIEPRRIAFVAKTAALFIATRTIFISLTHIAPPVNQTIIGDTSFLSMIGIGQTADLFFSGHTGMPFLMALIFWKDNILRTFFLAASIFFGASMLIGHIHYSIDVFSAFFITSGIFEIARRIFFRDYELLLKTENPG